MSADDDLLKPLRERIDALDEQLLTLLNERAQCALEVGKIKEQQPAAADQEATVFYRPERVAQILRRLTEQNPGPLSDADVETLFREITACCLGLETPMSVAYFGPQGTYTEAATLKQFGHFVQTSPMASIDEVFREVESGVCDYGVVPVENSTEGMVNLTLDCLLNTNARVCAEVELPIHHALMRAKEAAPDHQVSKIVSHAQSLAQCRAWLDQHYPGVPRTAVASNAEAAKQAAADPSLLAVAGEMAADRYDLRVLATRIEDNPHNKTRFLVLGRQYVGPSGHDKTSILVSVKNEPGALLRVLSPFQANQIGLTRIETRPARSGDWSYVFFIDFDGHESQAEADAALKDVKDIALEVRVLGSYPKASGQE
jgi:chorismate mutase/prephenate dehydratase